MLYRIAIISLLALTACDAVPMPIEADLVSDAGPVASAVAELTCGTCVHHRQERYTVYPCGSCGRQLWPPYRLRRYEIHDWLDYWTCTSPACNWDNGWQSSVYCTACGS